MSDMKINICKSHLIELRRCKSLDQIKSSIAYVASDAGNLKGDRKAIALFIIAKVKTSKKSIYDVLINPNIKESRAKRLILSSNPEKLFRDLFRVCASAKAVSHESIIDFLKYFSFDKKKKAHLVRKVFSERYKKVYTKIEEENNHG